MANYTAQHELLDSLIDRYADETRHNLAMYFDGGSFTGAYYDVSRHNGNPDTARNSFTATDVGAVAMLSVDIPPDAALDILHRRSERLSEMLSHVPTKPIWEADAEDLISESPAGKTFDELKRIKGINWVTAGKLLARKRPHLVPIYDTVTRAELGRPDGFWRCMWEYFDTDSSRVDKWQGLESAVPRIDDISVLRRIDVALWMRGTGD